MADEKTVSVSFRAMVNVELAGDLQIPVDVWNDKDTGDMWGDAAEKYIRDRLQLDTHWTDDDRDYARIDEVAVYVVGQHG